MTEVPAEIEVIPTEAPALRHAKEALERGEELRVERQKLIKMADRSRLSGVPQPCVVHAAQMGASRGFRATGNPPQYVPTMEEKVISRRVLYSAHNTKHKTCSLPSEHPQYRTRSNFPNGQKQLF